MRSNHSALIAVVAAVFMFVFGAAANIALAETFCPEGGERYSGSEKFCPTHGVKLKQVAKKTSSKKVVKVDLAALNEKGEKLKEKEKYREAMVLFRKAADKRYAPAQRNIGKMYKYGMGVKQDYQEGYKWLKMAADQGDAGALHSIGYMYQAGQSFEKDYVKAIKWTRKAADKRWVPAQADLGYMLRVGGYGVAKDPKQAYAWLIKAARGENSFAQYHVAEMYKNGEGTGQDEEKAFYWLKKSAGQGYSPAQSSLDIALYNALVAKDLHKARNLLAAGVSPDAKISHKGLKKAPLLSFAIEYKSPAVIEFLIRAGADPRLRDDKGVSPLIKAIWTDDLDPVYMKMLLATKHDLDLDNLKNGRANKTLLGFACFHENVGVVRALLDGGADANAQNKSGRSPLFVAASKSGPEARKIVNLLLQKGARINARSNSGMTPLMGANGETISLLIRNGAKIDARDHEGKTALMHSVINPFRAATRSLLKNGARFGAEDHSGKTAVDYAETQVALDALAYSVRIHNKTNRKIDVALHYLDNDMNWKTDGYWQVGPGEKSKRIVYTPKINGGKIYYFAHSRAGKWSGSNRYKVRGKTRGFKKKSLPANYKERDYFIVIN